MKKIRILNVGCGKQKYGTHFLDIYPSRKDVKKYNADKDKIPFPNEYFDEVYCRNLFEHLKNPFLFLKEVYRVLKKGGKFVLITDNALFWFWQVSRVHSGGYEKQETPEDKHYALFTSWHIENYFKAFNFKKIDINFFMIEESIKQKPAILLSKIIRIFFPKASYNCIMAVGIK